MATTTALMTVEQFQMLPEDDGPFQLELHHGECVPVPRPKPKHQIIQGRMRDLLKAVAPPGRFVDSEVPFRPLPEYELRVADVAYISRERWLGQDLDQFFRGAPDVVVEVLSPSNTIAEMSERESLCLQNGALEFWVIDPSRGEIRVSRSDGIRNIYHSNEEIPLRLLGSVTISVNLILG